MAAQPRNVSALLWALAIEPLAYSHEVDVNTLIDTFNSSPKFTSDVGSNAREMVSFRILERLFDPDTRRLKSVGRNPGVSFDFSKRCEDVLEHIMRETPEPNTWNEPEMSKWHVQPFIAYKRSCLPKPALQRLKDALLEGTPTFLKSFHQLVTSQLNQHGTKVHEVNGVNINDGNETSLHLNQHGTKTHEVNGATFTNEKESPGINDKVCQNTSNEGNKRGKDGDFVEQNNESQPSNDDELHQNEYSQALSDYWAAEKKTSLARNNLVSFNCATLNHMPKTSLNESKISNGVPDPDFTILIDESPESSGGKETKKEDYVDYVCSDGRGCNEENKKEVYVDRSVRPGNPAKPPNGVSNPDLISERFECTWGNECSEGTNKENAFADRTVRLRERTKPPNGVSNLKLYDESSESSDGKGCREGSNKEENYVVHAVRPRKRTLSSPSLQVPQRRRVPVPWTQSEEDTLKKWVAKFTSDSNILGRGFPWSRILDLGASKFQRGRTPVDLKDKWRNIQKASKKSK
ncbi:homeodomain-like, zinc finger, RING/FYVE/PHD-type containing protein [Tanacetum coccineum]|uniref:Homeodomain-like, zinc finger, RING/FYVE/PHD-type containing protein n=1 Tax=Tanacetum coccineum TaxID=301880 RepID=A0ABQ5HG76_9ASTR